MTPPSRARIGATGMAVPEKVVTNADFERIVETTDEWITSFRTMLDRKEIGWTFWPYKKLTTKSSCVVTVKAPKDWEKIAAYANLPRTSYEDVRKARLDPKLVEAAFAELLENVRIERCEVNRGYLAALGLDSKVTVAGK